jgi:polygalacturonase
MIVIISLLSLLLSCAGKFPTVQAAVDTLLVTSAGKPGNKKTAANPSLPVIPAGIFNILDFGAVGDGSTLNTAAIQKAIDKAGMKGGTVVVPKGNFLCGPLTLHSQVGLQLDKNAVLLMRNDIAGYPIDNNRYLNFVSAANVSDIKISGEGTIDGQGDPWWTAFRAKQLTPRRPQMVYIERCTRLEITGVHFLNPPNTHVSLRDCRDVTIHDITITAPERSPNTDGLNISVKNCLIEDCTIATGDDNIAFNFGARPGSAGQADGPECRDIIVRNCRFGYGHGLSIGSFTAGGLDGLTVSHCTFDGTTSGIRMKSARGRGALVSHLDYSGIKMKNVRWPIFISGYYPKEPAQPQDDPAQQVSATTPQWKDIVLRDIDIEDATNAVLIWGLPELPVENVLLENIHIHSQKGARIYNAKGITFSGSDIHSSDNEKVKTYNAEIKGL